MSFTLRCVITTVADEAEAAAVIATLTAALPRTRGRMFERPFRGVLVGADPCEVRRAHAADPAGFADVFARLVAADPSLDPADVDELEASIDWMLPILLADASRALPDKTLAYVDVDCFGGVCMYSGEVVRAGERIAAVDRLAPDGHQRLLAQLGVGEVAWSFPPFERGFLDGAPSSGEARRPITAIVEGTLSLAGYTLERLAPMLFVGLAPDWAVVPIARTILLTAGRDDVLLSLNPAREPGQVEVGGRCHADPGSAAVEAPLAALAECFADFGLGFTLTLGSPAGTPLRRWAGP